MVDINLHKAAESEFRVKKSSSIFKSSAFISFSLLALVLIVYGATLLYQVSLENTKENLEKTKNAELLSINKDAINEVVDFQERLDNIVINLENKRSPKTTLDTIERLMVKGAFLNSLIREGDNMEIEAVADTFKTAASQMLSFKKNEMFDDIRITDSGRDDIGRVIFSLEAELKK